VQTAVLESDALRKVFSSVSGYDDRDREYFYRSIAFIGRVLTERGVSVIFDATANRRAYRDRAREEIPRFLEVYVDTPLEVCIQRDPKGIYRKGLSGEAIHVPGIGAEYEPPLNPEFVFHGEKGDPEEAARRVVEIVEAL
jgi:adenylylsulfate kinase